MALNEKQKNLLLLGILIAIIVIGSNTTYTGAAVTGEQALNSIKDASLGLVAKYPLYVIGFIAGLVLLISVYKKDK